MSTWQATPFLHARLRAACLEWDERDGTRRLFARDATLWTGADEARWLDWLDLRPARAALAPATELLEAAREDGLNRVLVVGMGGSSLGPEVLGTILGDSRTGLPLGVIDTLDPARLRAVLGGIDLSRVLVLVASKSGSTLEPNLVKDLLLDRLRAVSGKGAASRHLVAITDPGSNLEKEARAGSWRAIIPGVPAIGGRYSVLSAFGIVPAVLAGIDAEALIAQAEAMRLRCMTEPAETNPGVSLGIALGTLAREGRDKLTLVTTRGLSPFGAWIEQLVAESTGKRGGGIVPVDLEPARVPRACGDDRVFVALRLATEPAAELASLDAHLLELADEGHPVIRCHASSGAQLGSLFYQWEVATAVAGAVLGIHPFDQPDVEAAKIAARARLAGAGAGEGAGEAPERVVLASEQGLVAEAGADLAAEMLERLPPEPSVADVLSLHVGRVRPPGWIGLLAWRCEDERLRAALASLRRVLGKDGLIATTLGVGPRFLHSTGQLHKGGPATGTFIQVIGPASEDLPVPGSDTSFAHVLLAQAEGDFDVLASRGRRVLLLRVEDAAGLALFEALSK